MKTKTILLSSLFVVALTIQNAAADCPQVIIYPQYKKLMGGEEVEGYIYANHFMGFHMTPGEILYYNAVEGHPPSYCAYTHKSMIGQQPSMLTIKLKGPGSSKKNKK